MGDNAVHIALDKEVPKLYDQYGQGLGAEVLLRQDKVLTDAQIKTTPASPVTVVPAVPGKLIVVHRAMLRLISTVAYTNIADVNCIRLSYNDLLVATTAGANNFWGNDSDQFLLLGPKLDYITGALATYRGVPIVLSSSNSDNSPYTGGGSGNSVTVTTWYSLE